MWVAYPTDDCKKDIIQFPKDTPWQLARTQTAIHWRPAARSHRSPCVTLLLCIERWGSEAYKSLFSRLLLWPSGSSRRILYFFFSALGIKQRIDVTAFMGLWLNRRKELLLIIASEWGLAILGCPRDSGFYSCENISSRFLSICYPFCIKEVGPRSLSIEIGWKKISFICLFELDVLLSNWSFSPPPPHPFSSLIQMSSPHFELFSSKIPDPQVPSVVVFCRFKNSATVEFSSFWWFLCLV